MFVQILNNLTWLNESFYVKSVGVGMDEWKIGMDFDILLEVLIFLKDLLNVVDFISIFKIEESTGIR